MPLILQPHGHVAVRLSVTYIQVQPRGPRLGATSVVQSGCAREMASAWTNYTAVAVAVAAAAAAPHHRRHCRWCAL